MPRYQQHIQADTGKTVIPTNLGVNGWQSSDLLAALRSDARFRSERCAWNLSAEPAAGPDNQDCLRRAVAQFKLNWDAIVAEVLALRDPNATILRTMDIYNPFVVLDQLGGRFALLSRYLKEVNDYIISSAARNNIFCARVQQAFNGCLPALYVEGYGLSRHLFCPFLTIGANNPEEGAITNASGSVSRSGLGGESIIR